MHASAKLIDGTAIGQAMRGELGAEIAALKAQGVTPGLAAVLVGENPASATYVRMKGKACDEAGLYHETLQRPKDMAEADLLALVDRLNADPKVHGILVQLPLPKHINAARVLLRIDPAQGRGRISPDERGQGLDRRPDGLPARHALRRAAAAAAQRRGDDRAPTP